MQHSSDVITALMVILLAAFIFLQNNEQAQASYSQAEIDMVTNLATQDDDYLTKLHNAYKAGDI